MSMNGKTPTAWFVWPVTLSFGINHFWATTIYFVGRAVALNLVALKGLARVAAGICGVTFLP